jgi:regulator of RNase E activity RraA
VNPPSDATTNLLKRVSTATLTTQLFRRGFRNAFMQGVASLGRVGHDNLVGPAFTLRNIPAIGWRKGFES